jgi:uncharacterized protein (TIGR00369 family)
MSEPTPATRTLTATWEDPAVAAAQLPRLSGLDYLHAICSGALPPPPLARLLGLELVSVEEGRVSFAVTPAEYHYNPLGTVHGGVTSTLCDSALGCAVHSTLPAGTGYTTVDLKVTFLRPITIAIGRVICEATALHVGGRIAAAEARAFDAAGTLYAHATATCLILRPANTSPASNS